MRNVSSEAERAKIAEKLKIRELLPALEQFGDGLAAVRAKAHEMGLVFDNETVASMGELQRKAEVASKVIDTNLKRAFLNLAPELVAVAQGFAEATRTLTLFISLFQRAKNLDSDTLRNKQALLNAKRDALVVKYTPEELHRDPAFADSPNDPSRQFASLTRQIQEGETELSSRAKVDRTAKAAQSLASTLSHPDTHGDGKAKKHGAAEPKDDAEAERQKALRIAQAGTQAIDAAIQEEISARTALAGGIEAQARLALEAVDADEKRRADKLLGDSAEGKITDAAMAEALALQGIAADRKREKIERDRQRAVDDEVSENEDAIRQARSS